MSPLHTKSAVTTFAILSLATTLAGCTPTAGTGTDTGTGTDSGNGNGSVTHGDYKDGTYTEGGDYEAPSGTEHVDVTVTLAGNVITDVKVVGDATDPTAKLHQGEFISGIASVVKGKNIDELDVHKVGGSSLTSGGFNAAIELIKTDAAA